MAKDLTARNRIAAYLSSNGPVEDRDGRATAVLKDAVGYAGTALGFVQLVSSMEKAGHIVRDVRGKRTYRIAVTEETHGAAEIDTVAPGAADRLVADVATAVATAAAPGGGVGADLDYDQLAASLLSQVTRALSARSEPSQPTASVRRRVDQLVARNAELEREVARARAERDSVGAERDELRNQLEAASHNLSLLTERLGTPRKAPPGGAAADRLGSEERALLYRLSERGGNRREAAS